MAKRFNITHPAEDKINVAIDASNIIRGGGVTHLVEILSALNPSDCKISNIVVFGRRSLLDQLPEKPWLSKVTPPALNYGGIIRAFWQKMLLEKEVRTHCCDVLFVPGGSYASAFHPVITMSRNMLPFEWNELRRYGLSFFTLKLLLLRFVQTRSFRRVDGLIFLSEYANCGIRNIVGGLSALSAIIPHGLNPRFLVAPKPQLPISIYSSDKPYRVLYVSIIDQYKHQWHVVEAVAALRQEGIPVSLDLIGPAYPPALKRLQETLSRLDPDGCWARYHGPIPFEALHQHYADADAGLFASSCENMPNILLETMASGLPVACSNRGPMPEVLGDTGVYFDPEQPHDIARALRQLLASPELRAELARASYERAQQYSWQRCADETFKFLAAVALR